MVEEDFEDIDESITLKDIEKKIKGKVNISFDNNIDVVESNIKNSFMTGEGVRTSSSPDILSLEKEIEEKRFLLEQRKKEEQIKIENEKLKKLHEELRQKQEIEIQKKKDEVQDIFFNEDDIKLDAGIDYIKRCPKCDGRLKRTFVRKRGIFHYQSFLCKNKQCDFKKEVKLII